MLDRVPEGYLTKFNTGRLRPEVQPLNPFYIPFIEKTYPFHIPTLEHCTPFLSLFNEVNEHYYGGISNITRGNAISASIRNILINGPFKYLNGRFLYPFIYLVKSLTFYITKA